MIGSIFFNRRLKKFLSGILPLAVFLVFCENVRGQKGTIEGKIVDRLTSEPIPGATVRIKNSNYGAATDIDGTYRLTEVDSGSYEAEISSVSYTQTVVPVSVFPDSTTVLDVELSSDAKELSTVVVTGAAKTGSERAVISEIRRLEQIATGLSSDRILKNQDRDASQAVARMTGITLSDSRFIMIRGLSERYNAVLFNGVFVPSTEADVKSFSFDLIPSSVIDKMLIYKSGAAELPGEFAGGTVKIATKMPSENTTSFSLSISYRTGTTAEDFRIYKGGKYDFLGFDDGTRKLPGSFPSDLNNLSGKNLEAVGRSLPGRWSSDVSRRLPDIRAGFVVGRSFHLGSVQVGHMTSLNYTNTAEYRLNRRNRYENPGRNFSDTTFSYSDDQYRVGVRIGILHNWSFRFNERHKIDFSNFFNRLADSETVLRTGQDVANGFDVKNYAFRYEGRSIYSGQLHGSHKFGTDERTSLSWTGAYSFAAASQPDYRRARTQRNINSDDPYKVVVPPSASTFDAARFFSNLTEHIITFRADLERDLGWYCSEERVSKFRAGMYAERRNRAFRARWLSYTRVPMGFNEGLLDLPIERIFAEQNINAESGFELEEGTNPSDRYKASNLLTAGYASLSLSPGERWSIAAGVRTEYNRQQLNSATFGGEPVRVDNPIFSILPSVNVTYRLSAKSLLRAAYFMTVNRPEFREISPFSYYDFNSDMTILGQPDLRTPSIQNFDLRWELYPSASEQITAGVFYKQFKDPIEMFLVSGSSGITLRPGNARLARSIGAEVEVKKSMKELFASGFLSRLGLVLNAAYIKSTVSLGTTQTSEDEERPMMGQSPYIVNAGLYFEDEKSHIQANVLYNIYGRRIFAVGDYLTQPTVYEMPRHVVDINFTKQFRNGKWELRAGVRDILNSTFRFAQDSDADSRITSADGDVLTFRRGALYTVGFGFKF